MIYRHVLSVFELACTLNILYILLKRTRLSESWLCFRLQEDMKPVLLRTLDVLISGDGD
jgi:hypothetical protein